MNGIEYSIYFMLAMMFVAMPGAVIAGISWEVRKRTRAARAELVDDGTLEEGPEADASTTES